MREDKGRKTFFLVSIFGLTSSSSLPVTRRFRPSSVCLASDLGPIPDVTEEYSLNWSTNITEISEKMMKNLVADIRGFYPSGMVGFPKVDQSGIMQARRDSDGCFGFVFETELEDSDGDFGFDLNHYHDAGGEDDDDLFEDAQDEDASDSE